MLSEFKLWYRCAHYYRSGPLKDDTIAVNGWKVTLSNFHARTHFDVYAEFYIDEPNNTIAIKPVAERSTHAYLMEKHKYRFGLKRIVNTLKIMSGIYPAYWDEEKKWLVFKYHTLPPPP